MIIILPVNFFPAFALTLIAGLATGIGGIIAVYASKSKHFLPFSLGFSAGVMIYVSFVELFFEAKQQLIAQQGAIGSVLVVIGFFLGMLIITIIDKLLPEEHNPHEVANTASYHENHTKMEYHHHHYSMDNRLKKVGLMTTVGIVIHNFPEGIATFASGVKDMRLGVVICVAIAIHNIPEGIAVAVPIFYSTDSKPKALRMAFLSGLAEPAGALVGMLILNKFMNDTVFGMLLAAVAGIMVFISLDELLPTAQEYGEHHVSIYGLITGMAVMAITLLVL